MPLWLLLLIMVLGTYRLTRLVVKDTFPPVLWLRDHFVGGWRPLTEGEWKIVRNRPTRAGVITSPLSKDNDPLPFHVADVDHGDGPVASRWVDRWTWVPTWLSDLLSCPWCASGWVSLIMVIAVAFTVGVPAPVLVWPAVWAAGALIAAQKWS